MGVPFCFARSKSEEIAYIRKETKRLEVLISELTNARAALLQRLNALASPVMSLPVETLSIIFGLAGPPNGLKDQIRSIGRFEGRKIDKVDISPMTLSAVSSYWHDIVHANPWFWASINLSINPENVKRRAALLRLYLESSKGVPISLALSYSHDFHEQSTAFFVHESVDPIIIDTLPRTHGLHLVRPVRAWFSYLSSLPQTADHLIHDPPTAPLYRFPEDLYIPRASSLTTVQHPGYGPTSLIIMHLPILDIVEILLNCPNLNELHYQQSSTDFGAPVTFRKPVYLSHLRVLGLYLTGGCIRSRVLIQHLHVPALEELRWEIDFLRPLSLEDIEAFFRRLPSTLSKADL
ncbi:hypothetical protein AN958_07789 [Leucoagaricus sp. SymC.cos]|nr:hypothetical protein AN958_07789 [Leucoagaricus sp. SymC.cos]